MPTNLPPDYHEAERRFREAESIDEKIARLEEMMSLVPKHKGTDKLRADLRRRLSELRRAPRSQKAGARYVSPYAIGKEGAGQVVLVGAPNTGKSALVSVLTHAKPEVADYPFTTWEPTPGMMPYGDIQIQLVDTPPLNAEYVEPGLLDLIRRADLVLIVVDLQANPVDQFEETLALLREHRILPERVFESYGPDAGTYVPMMIVANKSDDEA
ncbi:MAG: GTPase [Anaerolineae bacterium]